MDGINGVDGTNGLSAYEVWLNEGNTGTEQEFLDSLEGAQGPQGEQGPAGVDGLNGVDGSTIVTAGTDITITGDGTPGDPYVVNSTAVFIETNTALAFDGASSTLTYTNEDANNAPIDLSPLSMEPWLNQADSEKATANTQDIYQMGKVGIGTDNMLGTTDPDVVLAINGAMLTTVSIYADYVFEDYFEGSSTLNSRYSFKSLGEVEKFINDNRHLPGIAKIDALEKNDKGDYVINASELSVQVLEKVEELFLHTIEQQRQLEAKESEIRDLRERIERLEKLLLKE